MIPGSTSLQAIFGVGGGTQWIINHLSLVSLGFEADSEYTYVTLSKLNLFDASNKMLFGAIADFQNYIRHNTRLWQIVSLFFFSCTSSQMGLGRCWSVLLCLPSGINRVYHTVIYLYVAHSSVYPWNSKAGETAGVQKIAWKSLVTCSWQPLFPGLQLSSGVCQVTAGPEDCLHCTVTPSFVATFSAHCVLTDKQASGDSAGAHRCLCWGG